MYTIFETESSTTWNCIHVWGNEASARPWTCICFSDLEMRPYLQIVNQVLFSRYVILNMIVSICFFLRCDIVLGHSYSTCMPFGIIHVPCATVVEGEGSGRRSMKARVFAGPLGAPSFAWLPGAKFKKNRASASKSAWLPSSIFPVIIQFFASGQFNVLLSVHLSGFSRISVYRV